MTDDEIAEERQMFQHGVSYKRRLKSKSRSITPNSVTPLLNR